MPTRYSLSSFHEKLDAKGAKAKHGHKKRTAALVGAAVAANLIPFRKRRREAYKILGQMGKAKIVRAGVPAAAAAGKKFRNLSRKVRRRTPLRKSTGTGPAGRTLDNTIEGKFKRKYSEYPELQGGLEMPYTLSLFEEKPGAKKKRKTKTIPDDKKARLKRETLAAVGTGSAMAGGVLLADDIKAMGSKKTRRPHPGFRQTSMAARRNWNKAKSAAKTGGVIAAGIAGKRFRGLSTKMRRKKSASTGPKALRGGPKALRGKRRDIYSSAYSDIADGFHSYVRGF